MINVRRATAKAYFWCKCTRKINVRVRINSEKAYTNWECTKRIRARIRIIITNAYDSCKHTQRLRVIITTAKIKTNLRHQHIRDKSTKAGTNLAKAFTWV